MTAQLIATGLLMALAAWPQATLVRDGKATSVIVVPDGQAPVARQAAALLQKTFARMTGAQIPIEPESRASRSASPARVWLSVGNTRFAASKGLRFEALKPEEIRLVAAPEYLIAAGNDGPADCSGKDTQRGTYFAAVELLERLGVRWLWPGESGEVVPARKTVTVNRLDYAFTPPLVQRYVRFTAKDAEFRYGVKLAEAGLDPGDWPLNMRLGHSRRLSLGHNFGDWYEKYFKTHPEYFAVGEDGKTFGWLNEVRRSKLCVSNPAVLDRVVEQALAHYSGCAHPRVATFSLSPTDNQAGHCMCATCRKLDALDGPKETWNFNTGEGGKIRTQVHHVSLSDRYLTFWNRVAERVEKQAPDLLLGAIAYGVYRRPPVRARGRENLLIGYVGLDYTNDAIRRLGLQDWDGWTAKVRHMMLRPNFMREGYGFPLLWPLRMGEDLQRFVRTGMMGVDIPNFHRHWGTQGLNYYVLVKMLWNPGLDPQGIIDDYCDKGFGPAAAPIRKYYARLIRLTDELAAYNGRHDTDASAILARGEETEKAAARPATPAGSHPSAWEVVYTPAVMNELEGYLREARRLAGAPEYAERVAFLALGFEYARLDLKMKQARAQYLRAPKVKESTVNFVRALVELEEWRKRHASSSAVGIVASYGWFQHQQVTGTPAGRFVSLVIPEKMSEGSYKLSLLAFSSDKRLAQMQLSADGKNWAEARPYQPEVTWRGTGRVFARFLLESERGSEWSKPVQADL